MLRARSRASRPQSPGTSPLEDLNPYDRATVNLWTRSHRELIHHPQYDHLMEAAMHAVLTGLRRYRDARSLFSAYETGAAADFALIRSLLPGNLSEEPLWMVRDAAFHLRWVELMDSP